ncbi:MAG: hypothetical protein ACE148_05410 [Vicinamibacterales bacterium]
MRLTTNSLIAVSAALVLSFAATSAAQGQITATDIGRLQESVFAASGEVSRLRARDRQLSEQLQYELDDLRDEVVYLRVKLRREGRVSAEEYNDLRDRIQALRSRATGGDSQPARASQAAPTSGRSGASATRVPVGQEIDVRLQEPLSSKTAQVEDRFTATTMVDLVQDGDVLIPAGSVVRGFVSGVDKATRLERKGRLSLALDQITIGGRSYDLRASVTEALESEGVRGEAGKIGAGGAVGGIIGGILGGFKGALAGILIGAGGVVAATPGEDVELPAGTVLRLRLDSPLDLGARSR